MGIVSLKDLYFDRHFGSFEQLQSKFSLPKSHFFRYLQLRHYVQQATKSYELPPENNALFKSLLGPPKAKHPISVLVGYFSSILDWSTIRIKQAWEGELGIEIEDKSWDEVLTNIKSCSINARLQLIQYKIVHRLHYSKTRLTKIFPNLSPLCNRCNAAEGTLAHLFWTLAKLHNFWSLIFQWFSSAFNITVTPDPETALLGHSNILKNLDCNIRIALIHGMMIAKRCILKLWKSDLAPKFETWLRELLSILHVERLRYELSGNPLKFSRMWSPVLEHMNDQ